MAGDSENMSEFIHKKVDESWKDSVQKEKQDSGQVQSEAAPETDFLGFVSGIAIQTLVALGEAPNPSTGKKDANLSQAQHLIDTLQMLSDKTTGNLSAEEDSEMKTILYQLRLKFVEKTQESKA